VTSVNSVSRAATGPNYKPLTWGNVVSEGGVEPFAYAGVLSADFIIGGAA
jgi:hypothetical protein